MSNMTKPVVSPFTGSEADPASDAIWVSISAFIIFTMQNGFGLLESGMVSGQNEANVMVKNMLGCSLGGIAWWMFGYAFGFGDKNDQGTGTMSGLGFFFWDEMDDSTEAWKNTHYIFQLSFASTAVTIVSGAVAERVKLKSYMIFAMIFTGFVYPFPTHWLWGGGWLADLGAHDFAGSSVVHMSGGAAAFAAAALLGPRDRRFGKDRKEYPMACPTNVIQGTFFLWWGWIGFNCGSTFGVTGGMWKVASKVSVVTMNGAMSGGAAAVLYNIICFSCAKRAYLIDIPQLASGVLGGLVAITAPAACIQPWEGMLVGFIGGIVANLGIAMVNAMEVDDPVGCVGVHYLAGVWGMIAVGLFAGDPAKGLSQTSEPGVFRGGSGHLLGANLAAVVVVTLWSGGLTAFLFTVLKYIPGLGIRMDSKEEELGSDMIEHDIYERTDLPLARGPMGRGLPASKTTSLATTQFSDDIQKLELTVNDGGVEKRIDIFIED